MSMRRGVDVVRPFRRGAALAALVATMHASRSAHAAESPPRLRVERSEGAADCPDATALADAVSALMGHPALSSAPRAAAADADEEDAIDAEFGRSATQYVATIRTRGSSPGVRAFTGSGPTCVGIADAVAVALVLLLDRSAPENRASRVEPSIPLGDGPESSSRVSPSKPSERREPLPWPVLGIDAGAIVTRGLVGDVAPGVFAGVHWSPWRPFAIDLGALWLPRQTFRLAPGAVHVSLLTARMDLCAVPLRRPLTLSLCAGPWLGALEGSSEGFSVDEQRSPPWVGLASGVIFAGPLRAALGWTGRAEIVVPVIPRHFAVPNAGEAFAQAPVALVLAVGGRLSIL